jgi:hypothetical protein
MVWVPCCCVPPCTSICNSGTTPKQYDVTAPIFPGANITGCCTTVANGGWGGYLFHCPQDPANHCHYISNNNPTPPNGCNSGAPQGGTVTCDVLLTAGTITVNFYGPSIIIGSVGINAYVLSGLGSPFNCHATFTVPWNNDVANTTCGNFDGTDAGTTCNVAAV